MPNVLQNLIVAIEVILHSNHLIKNTVFTVQWIVPSLFRNTTLQATPVGNGIAIQSLKSAQLTATIIHQRSTYV